MTRGHHTASSRRRPVPPTSSLSKICMRALGKSAQLYCHKQKMESTTAIVEFSNATIYIISISISAACAIAKLLTHTCAHTIRHHHHARLKEVSRPDPNINLDSSNKLVLAFHCSVNSRKETQTPLSPHCVAARSNASTDASAVTARAECSDRKWAAPHGRSSSTHKSPRSMQVRRRVRDERSTARPPEEGPMWTE